MTKDVTIVLFSDPASDRAAQGLVGAGQQLSEALGGSLHAIAIDPQQYQPEGALNALVTVCRELSPRAILLSNDTYSQEITPRLAHRLGGSAAGDGLSITGLSCGCVRAHFRAEDSRPRRSVSWPPRAAALHESSSEERSRMVQRASKMHA